jgi:predicted nucleic acid-binding Zn ribbon protein
MYYCETCNVYYYDEEVPEWEEHETGYIHRECPMCGDDLKEANQCACGQFIPPDDYYCGVCQDKADEVLDALCEELGFSDEDFEGLLNDYFNRKEEKQWKSIK